jgi:hypothetical protein
MQAERIRVADSYIAAFYSDVKRGVPVEDTEYYRFLTHKISIGLFWGGCHNQADVDVYFQTRLQQMNGALDAFVPPVRIRHDGTVELLDAHHRVSRLIVEGRTVIEVEVKEVSQLFANLERDLFSIYGKKWLYQEIEHPYFADWECNNPGRLDTIARYLDAAIADGRIMMEGAAIDYGCLTGGIARIFSARGFKTFGLDCDVRALAIAEYLDFVLGKSSRVNYARVDLLAPDVPYYGWPVNVCTALSLFHHWLRAEHIEKLKIIMPAIGRSCNLLITDVPATKNTFTDSVIPLDQVKAFYMSLLPGHDVETIGWFDDREMLALWRKPQS